MYLKHCDWISSNLKVVQKEHFHHSEYPPTRSLLAPWEKKWGMMRKKCDDFCCSGVSAELQPFGCLELPWGVFVLQQVLIFKHLLKAYWLSWHSVRWPRLTGAICLHRRAASNPFHEKAIAVTSTGSFFNSNHPECRHLNLIFDRQTMA